MWCRPLNHGIFSHLRETEASLADYRDGEAEPAAHPGRLRAQLPRDGPAGAGRRGLAGHVGGRPVWRAGGAAGAGRRTGSPRGDLTARVETGRDPEEIAVLSRAFNRMTRDLQAQQEALRDAQRDAESPPAVHRDGAARASAPASSAWTPRAGSRPSTARPMLLLGLRAGREPRPQPRRGRAGTGAGRRARVASATGARRGGRGGGRRRARRRDPAPARARQPRRRRAWC